METYTITRFEEKGNELFICLNSTNNPVYLEHFFDENEKLDVKGTIEKLVAQLEIMDSEYVAPLPVIDKKADLENITIDSKKVALQKTAILEAKQLEAVEPLEEKVIIEDEIGG